jgi:hypothetical protein
MDSPTTTTRRAARARVEAGAGNELDLIVGKSRRTFRDERRDDRGLVALAA